MDGELGTFFKSVKEIKEIRDSIGALPDKLKQGELDIENQKREAEGLITSARNLLMTFEEQSKGLLYDLEKKTESMTGDVKAGVSELENVFEANSAKLNNEHKERLEKITSEYEHIREFFEDIKGIIDSHEESICTLKENYMGTLKVFERVELSVKEIQNSVSELKKRPNEPDNRIKEVEAQLRELFFVKLERQKIVVLSMLAILMVFIIFFLFNRM